MKINYQTIEAFCQQAVVFCFYVLIFTLPISIAFVESFSAGVIFFYLILKITRSLQAEHFWKEMLPRGGFLGLILAINIGIVFISIFFSSFFFVSLYSFFSKFLQGCLLYYAFFECFKKKEQVIWFLGFFLVSVLLITLSGFNQIINQVDFIRGNLLHNGRVSSTLRHANDFGAYLIIVVTLFFSILLKLNSFKWPLGMKVITVIAGVMAIASLGLTYSRSSWIGFCVAIFFVALFQRKFIYSCILIFLFMFLFIPLMSNFRNVSFVSDDLRFDKQAYQQYTNSQEKSSDQQTHRTIDSGLRRISFLWSHFSGMGRLNFWQSAITIIKDKPLFGVGLNTYSKVAQDRNTSWNGYPHNCFLQMAAEIGLIGLLAFLTLISVLLFNVFKIVKTILDPLLQSVVIGATAGLIGFLSQSALDTTLYSVQLGNLMWIIMGLIVVVIYLDAQSRQKTA